MKSFIGKGYDRQRAAAYAVYMMAGSYFGGRNTADRFKNMYLHYAEMPREKQYDCESRVIAAMEELNKVFLRRISNLRCEVTCRICGTVLFMEFRTGGFEWLLCEVKKNGTFHMHAMRAKAEC